MNILSLKKALTIVIASTLTAATLPAQEAETRGNYFYKKEYTPAELPTFGESRHLLPSPLWDENPQWVNLYWKAWEIAFSNLKQPPKGSPLVANWIDEGLSPQIFQWDTHFMVMFGRYAAHIFPFIESHDNFYARQHDDGMICRILNEADGVDHHWGLGANYARTINPPLFSWAEMEYFKFTKDTARLAQIITPIEKYIAWVEKNRKATGTEHQLYWSNGQASGMDNTPRDMGRPAPDGDIHSATDAMGWIDMSSQIKMCYDNLAEICTILGEKKKAKEYRKKSSALAKRINRYMWDKESGLYYDVDTASVRTPWITTATFWPIIADISSPKQTARLVSAIKNEELFWRPLPLPSLAANQPHYDVRGRYWRGGVWAPTTYMTVKGLQKSGYEELATTIAAKNMANMYDVYERTGTIWELYSPEMPAPATDATGVQIVKPNFVGWSGLIPISMFIENIIGINADAVTNRVEWRSTCATRNGIEGLRFGDVVTSLVREGDIVSVESNKEYTLIINGKKFKVSKGKQTFEIVATKKHPRAFIGVNIGF
ncbi:MAG: hypothetical protein IJX41_08555 [Bacteroidaceae bacterium]|nr:hypothetical protein [Bacteroidaceae bacterium]